ncbi:MAG: hypothetical protein AAF628_26760 [Planctomycetota bacterium]
MLFLACSPAVSQTTEPPESRSQSEINASIARTIDEDRRALSYAGRYYIRVEGLPPLNVVQISDARTFRLLNAAGKTVPIRRATYLGASGDWDTPIRNSEEVEESRNDSQRPAIATYARTALWGDFRPDAQYRLVVRAPDGERHEVDVKKLHPGDDEASSLLQLMTDRISFELEAFGPDDGDEIGIRYDFDLSLGSLGTEHFWSLSLDSQGELSTETDSVDLQSALTAGLQADYRYHWRTTPLLRPDDRITTYPIGVRVSPIEIEASSDFDNLNYTAKVQLAAAVPILDDIVLLWHEWMDVNRTFFPPVVFAGYSYIDEIETTNERMITGDEHRLDLEFNYRFPLSNRLDARLQWRGFQGLETGEFVDRIDAGMIFYTNEGRNVAIQAMYSDGALPPEFRETSTFSLGLLTTF